MNSKPSMYFIPTEHPNVEVTFSTAYVKCNLTKTIKLQGRDFILLPFLIQIKQNSKSSPSVTAAMFRALTATCGSRLLCWMAQIPGFGLWPNPDSTHSRLNTFKRTNRSHHLQLKLFVHFSVIFWQNPTSTASLRHGIPFSFRPHLSPLAGTLHWPVGSAPLHTSLPHLLTGHLSHILPGSTKRSRSLLRSLPIM